MIEYHSDGAGRSDAAIWTASNDPAETRPDGPDVERGTVEFFPGTGRPRRVYFDAYRFADGSAILYTTAGTVWVVGPGDGPPVGSGAFGSFINS